MQNEVQHSRNADGDLLNIVTFFYCDAYPFDQNGQYFCFCNDLEENHRRSNDCSSKKLAISTISYFSVVFDSKSNAMALL